MVGAGGGAGVPTVVHREDADLSGGVALGHDPFACRAHRPVLDTYIGVVQSEAN